jgi:nucleoside-diphosphate-sugar epimerase
MLDGQPEDVVSVANACNRICQLAGLDHHVVDVDPSNDPELAEVFGPTLVAIATKAVAGEPVRRSLKDSKTYKRLGYDPISLDEGLSSTIGWLREIGRIS